MTEDDAYRTSTQYRLWSYTTEALASLRASTNALAAERVRSAIKRSRDGQASKKAALSEGSTPDSDKLQKNGESDVDKLSRQEKEIDCLTVEEELKLVQYYSEKVMDLADEYKPPLPTQVRATAVQYLRRFYLTNSPMTYNPKQLMPCALFLATKTDNCYMSLKSFADKVDKVDKTTPEDIIAPEFLLTQGLRFTFDVRHPFRGLDGGIMDLLAMAQGDGDAGPGRAQTAKELKSAILTVKPPSPSRAGEDITKRIALAHQSAKHLLKTAALFTDAYFLYAPSQIWLSALLLVDEPLVEFYLSIKLPFDSPILTKLLSALRACATLLQSYTDSKVSSSSEAHMKEMKRIGKKLYQCQNPEKMDLVSLTRAQKRDGDMEGSDVESAKKKRRLERERAEKEGEEVFGGELVKG